MDVNTMLKKGTKKAIERLKQMSILSRIIIQIRWFFYSLKVDTTDFESTIKALDTPWKVQAYMDREFTYRTDKHPGDQWKPAHQTWKDKHGDCEDYAIFSHECLKTTNYSGYYLCMYRKKGGHATYLIPRTRTLEPMDCVSWISVGTYGMLYHKGELKSIIKDWKNYENWTSFEVIRPSDMKKLHTGQR